MLSIIKYNDHKFLSYRLYDRADLDKSKQYCLIIFLKKLNQYLIGLIELLG